MLARQVLKDLKAQQVAQVVRALKALKVQQVAQDHKVRKAQLVLLLLQVLLTSLLTIPVLQRSLQLLVLTASRLVVRYM